MEVMHEDAAKIIKEGKEQLPFFEEQVQISERKFNLE